MNVWDLLFNSKEIKRVDSEEHITITCTWLNDSGFSQYVQMFNEGKFPISLQQVHEDNSDFDGGLLMALLRRIEVLNKAAEIKSGIGILELTDPERMIAPRLNKVQEELGDEDEDKENTASNSSWLHEPIAQVEITSQHKYPSISLSFNVTRQDLEDPTLLFDDNSPRKSTSKHILRSASVSRCSHQLFNCKQRGKNEPSEERKDFRPYYDNLEKLGVTDCQKIVRWKDERRGELVNESFNISDSRRINPMLDYNGQRWWSNDASQLDVIIDLLKTDLDSLDEIRSKMKKQSYSGIVPRSPIFQRKQIYCLDYQECVSDIETYSQNTIKRQIPFVNVESNVYPISSPLVIELSPTNVLSQNLNENNEIERNNKLYMLIEFTVSQVNVLRTFSILSCKSMLEKYCPPSKNMFNRKIPRLLCQKSILSDNDCTCVFGVNICTLQMRFGQPYPPVILNIFQFLREHGPRVPGIFRKAGLKTRSRILRNEIDLNPHLNSFDGYSVFDVADVLKSFYRDLPDRLLTGKLSFILVALYSYVPREYQFEVLQLALLSLSDENRIALEILIEFMSFLVSNSDITMMDVKCLSLMFAPNLFNLSMESNKNGCMRPLRRKKFNGPNVKQLAKLRASQLCIMDMIDHANSLFKVTEKTLRMNHKRLNDSRSKDINSQYHSVGLWQEWFQDKLNHLKIDAIHRKCDWINIRKGNLRQPNGANVEIEQLSYRKIGSQDSNDDGIVLRTWKVVIDIDASVINLFTNINEKRHIWDSNISSMDVLVQVSDYVDLVRLTSHNADGTSVPRCFNLLRGHQMGTSDSVNAIVSESVDIQHYMTVFNHINLITIKSTALHESTIVTGHIFCDNFMLEALSTTTSRITWISRVDLGGHHSDWYNNYWGHCLVKRAIELKRFSESNMSFELDSRDVACCPQIQEQCLRITQEIFNESRETIL